MRAKSSKQRSVALCSISTYNRKLIGLTQNINSTHAVSNLQEACQLTTFFCRSHFRQTTRKSVTKVKKDRSCFQYLDQLPRN